MYKVLQTVIQLFLDVLKRFYALIVGSTGKTRNASSDKFETGASILQKLAIAAKCVQASKLVGFCGFGFVQELLHQRVQSTGEEFKAAPVHLLGSNVIL